MTRVINEAVRPDVTQDVRHPVSGASFTLLQETFGALSQDDTSPLSTLSISNSSVSIDLWKGCRWQCAYCHVQGSTKNLDKNGFMPRVPVPYQPFSTEEVIEALVAHPFFEPDHTIISVGTASTEPFAPGEVEASTFALLSGLQVKGLRNPLWVVTKAGIPPHRIADIASIARRARIFALSLTVGGLSPEIEPVQNDRLRNARSAHDAGAKVILYLRPLVEAWGSSRKRIIEILHHAHQELGPDGLAAIAPGGLRWTPGIEYGLQARGISWPEDLTKDENEKDLPDSLWNFIVSESRALFPSTPVVKHSSCALSTLLEVSDRSLVFARKVDDCQQSLCSETQRGACALARGRLNDLLLPAAQAAVDARQLPVRLKAVYSSGTILTEPAWPTLKYSIQRMVIRAVGTVV